eukprot:2937679-Prymnesium_polylepis.1
MSFLVQNCNLSSVLEMCLDANITAGLQPDAFGRTALDTALEQGKWRALHMLLNALIERKFAMVPRGMTTVTATFDTMAHKFPGDFLRFIKKMPLQPEPEVLNGLATHDVMLPRFLVLGSSSRCPKGIWLKLCE